VSRSQWSTEEKSIFAQLGPQTARDYSGTRWDEISSALEKYGYRRTPNACRLYWKYMVRSHVLVRTSWNALPSTSKQSKLEELRRNALEVSHKETGLTHFQAIINYYSHEEERDK
jgi:Myb-like DNA-binding domain